MRNVYQAMLGLGLVCGTVAAGDEKPGALTDPVEILEKADAAARAVKAVSYKTTVEPTGSATTRLPFIEGKVRFTGWNERDPRQFVYEVKVTWPDSEEPKTHTVGSDGKVFYRVDHASKTAYVDIDPQVFGSLGGLRRDAPMVEFVHPTPFKDELNGKEQSFEGIEDVEGVPCYKVLVTYQQRRQKARWYFSTNDLLPRRVERTVAQGAGRTSTVQDLRVEKSLSADAFAFKLPDGYKQTDDFAP